MKKVSQLTISFIFTVFCVNNSVYATTSNTQSITYKNQRGSTMTLNWQPGQNNTGTLTGTFNSAVGSCKTDMNKPMPLTGFYNGNAISVIVNFPDCKAIAAMSGTLSNKRDQLETLWILTEQSKDSASKNWNSNIIGSDSFQKIG